MSIAPSSLPPDLPVFRSARFSLSNSVWRPVVTCSGALGLGVVLAHLLIKPVATHRDDNSLPELILPRDNTLIVLPSLPPGALLHGQVQLVADITGKSPLAGAVARQVVELGSHVKKGDPVVEISSGEAARPASAAESLQNQAEKSQIAASDAQNELAQKLAIAQAKLRSAQERVNQAQAQVSQARDVVRRLQKGEAVAATEIPAAFRDSSPSTDAKSAKGRDAQPAVSNAAAEMARQQALAARDAARSGEHDLQIARQMQTLAQKSAQDAAEKLKAAMQTVGDVEARFQAQKASGADVEAARAAQREAQTTANAADKAVLSAKAEVAKREDGAVTLQQYADKAQAEAIKAGAPRELAPQEPAPSQGEKSAAPTGQITLQQAIQFASAALDESRRASRDAEKIHTDIDDYQRQVNSSRSQIESASQNLASAQQKVLDSVPRPRFTPVVAPVDGIVTWISRLAREVGASQSVFGVSRGDKINARFEDKSGLWRGIKTGMTLPAFVTTPSQPAPGSKTGTQMAFSPSIAANNAATTDNRAVIAVKVTDVEPPASKNEAATVIGEVRPLLEENPNGEIDTAPSALLNAGTDLQASVARPGDRPTISVPVSALVQREKTTFIAVLSAAQGPKSDTAFRMRWQRVQTGRSDGLREEIVSGLSAGERVIVSTTRLEEMGLTPTESSLLGGTALATVSDTSKPLDVVVRLT